MQITFIAGDYQPDRCGVAHYTAHLRQHLAEKGVKSLVLTTHQSAFECGDRDVIGVVDRWHIRTLHQLAKNICKTPSDLLHIQHAAGTYRFDRSIFLLLPLLKLYGWKSPIVTTIHEYGWWEWQSSIIPAQWLERLKTFGQKRRWWDREDGFLLTQSNALVTTNADASNTICDRLPHLIERLHQIPIGANVGATTVDRAEAKRWVQQQCQWEADSEILAFFGFLHPVKGLETLLRSFTQVLQMCPTAKLLLIGGVESLALPKEQAERYWNKLETAIVQLGLTNKVYMTGYRPPEQVSTYLSAVDVGVLPFNHGVTLKSGSLLALFSHSLPVVATRSNPPDPELEDSRLLRLVPPKDEAALAQELLNLLQNPELRHQLSAAGYSFSRQFSWDAIAERHMSIYRHLLQRSPSESVQ